MNRNTSTDHLKSIELNPLHGNDYVQVASNENNILLSGPPKIPISQQKSNRKFYLLFAAVSVLLLIVTIFGLYFDKYYGDYNVCLRHHVTQNFTGIVLTKYNINVGILFLKKIFTIQGYQPIPSPVLEFHY